MKIEVEIITDEHAIVHAKCVSCLKLIALEATPEQLKRFLGGTESTQECFPLMDREYREMLISGFCPGCWKTLFKPKVKHG